MIKTIFFDHAYSGDQNHSFYKQLHKMGFTISEFMVKHPNSDCCFLYFGKGSYLEFVHNPDKNKILKKPGLSFAVRNNLEALLEKYKRIGLKCVFSHRNYNWRENNKDHLPGWNFLEFKKLGFRTFFPWFTEYEPNPNSKRKFIPVKHPNSVTGIWGHEFVINERGRDFFQGILGTKIKKKVTLDCGTVFYFKEGKNNHHSKVILKTKNIKKTSSFMKGADTISFDGRDGILIRNPSKEQWMWDILIIK